VADAIGAATAAVSLERVVHAPHDFDAVVVRVPLAERAGAIRTAAAAGKHVLVEAPIAATAAATQSLVDDCRAATVSLGIGGTRRFRPSCQAIVDRLAEGKLGEPGLLRIHRWSAGGTPPEAAMTLAEQTFADIDLSLSLFAALPTSLYAIGHAGATAPNGHPSMPPYLQVHCGFAMGGMALFDFVTSLPPGKNYDSLSLIGSAGAAYADDHHNTHLLFCGGDPRALVSHDEHLQVIGEWQAFVDAVVAQRPPPVGGSDCHAGQQVIDALALSLSTNRPVHARGTNYEPV
jgi:predicted dehydrogenase